MTRWPEHKAGGDFWTWKSQEAVRLGCLLVVHRVTEVFQDSAGLGKEKRTMIQVPKRAVEEE